MLIDKRFTRFCFKNETDSPLLIEKPYDNELKFHSNLLFKINKITFFFRLSIMKGLFTENN